MIAYKSPELKEQFRQVDFRLQIIVYALAAYTWDRFGKVTTITCVYRGDGGVHQFNRGVDTRTRNLTQAEGDEIYAVFNKHIEYDPDRPQLDVIHDERAEEDRSAKATDEHFHIQVDPSGQTILYRDAA